MHIEPGLYPSIVDIVVVMNNTIGERLGAQAFFEKMEIYTKYSFYTKYSC